MTLEELLPLAISGALLNLHVALPGKVESFDGDACKANVRPMVKQAVPTKTRGRKLLELPVIQNARVMYAGGGGFAIAYPLQAGDTGTLLFMEANHAGWGRTGENSDPGDLRRHSLAGGVFVPGLYTDGNKPAISSDSITLGPKDGSFSLVIKSNVVEIGGNSDAAALASKVNLLSQAFMNHSHVGSGIGAVTPTFTHSDVSSSKLKLGG